MTGIANIRRLHEAGARFGCGNDGGIPFAFPGALALELALLETIGFTAPELLRMATQDNARLLGLDHRLGTIAAGKVADLVAFDLNPLESAQHLARPGLVVKAGRIVFHDGRLAGFTGLEGSHGSSPQSPSSEA